jgi:hypothetical protein
VVIGRRFRVNRWRNGAASDEKQIGREKSTGTKAAIKAHSKFLTKQVRDDYFRFLLAEIANLRSDREPRKSSFGPHKKKECAK